MSGILRNTLRLVGTAKYATNNSTYLRSMMLTTNRLNHSSPLHQSNKSEKRNTQAKKILTNFWGTINAAGKNVLSIFEEEIKTSHISDFDVSLSNSRAALFSRQNETNCIFPSIFRTELNDKSIEPQQNKTNKKLKSPFQIGDWTAILAVDSLVLHPKCSNKSFILKQTVDVKAHIRPDKVLKDYSTIHTLRQLSSNVRTFPVKIITKTQSGDPKYHYYSPVNGSMFSKKLLEFGDNLPEILIEGDDKLTVEPNSFGRIKLQFPMVVSLENRQIIKLKNRKDTFTVCHTIQIEASEDKIIPKYEHGRADVLRIELESGHLLIQPMYSSKRSIMMKQEVCIEVDSRSAVPTLLVCPRLKRILGDEFK